MNTHQRILALDAAVTACEYPDIPANIQTALDLLNEELDEYFTEHASTENFEQFLLEQKSAIIALANNLEVFGG